MVGFVWATRLVRQGRELFLPDQWDRSDQPGVQAPGRACVCVGAGSLSRPDSALGGVC